MCPSQLLILNFLSRLIRIFEREWRWGGRGRWRGTLGSSDLAKLKSLLYGRIGRSEYTGWIPWWIFQNTHCSCKLSRVLFFFVTDKREPWKLGR